MTMCVLQSFLACLMLSCSFLGKYVFDAPVVLRLYKTYLIINTMATDIAFTITGYYWFYWALMNSSKYFYLLLFSYLLILCLFFSFLPLLQHDAFYGLQRQFHTDVLWFLHSISPGPVLAILLSSLYHTRLHDRNCYFLCLWRNNEVSSTLTYFIH